jgi:hypothetical protein
VSIILLIPSIVFIYKFFMLQKSCLTWFYISFGMGIIVNLAMMNIITVILMALFGWAVWDYVMHKKVNEKQLFS